MGKFFSRNNKCNIVFSSEQLGIGPLQVNIHKGSRYSLADAFLSPEALVKRKLSIRQGATVSRLIFEQQNKVTGVEFKDAQTGQDIIVRAQKEVIVCAGAVLSPAILMRSGIGAKQDLQHLSIPVVKDLPGVGQNLQDHIMVPVAVNTPNTVSLHSEETLGQLLNWLFRGTIFFCSTFPNTLFCNCYCCYKVVVLLPQMLVKLVVLQELNTVNILILTFPMCNSFVLQPSLLNMVQEAIQSKMVSQSLVLC